MNILFLKYIISHTCTVGDQINPIWLVSQQTKAKANFFRKLILVLTSRRNKKQFKAVLLIKLGGLS